MEAVADPQGAKRAMPLRRLNRSKNCLPITRLKAKNGIPNQINQTASKSIKNWPIYSLKLLGGVIYPIVIKLAVRSVAMRVKMERDTDTLFVLTCQPESGSILQFRNQDYYNIWIALNFGCENLPEISRNVTVFWLQFRHLWHDFRSWEIDPFLSTIC